MQPRTHSLDQQCTYEKFPFPSLTDVSVKHLLEEPAIQRTATTSTSSGSDHEELKDPAEIQKSRPLVLASQQRSPPPPPEASKLEPIAVTRKKKSVIERSSSSSSSDEDEKKDSGASKTF